MPLACVILWQSSGAMLHQVSQVDNFYTTVSSWLCNALVLVVFYGKPWHLNQHREGVVIRVKCQLKPHADELEFLQEVCLAPVAVLSTALCGSLPHVICGRHCCYVGCCRGLPTV